MIIETQLEYRLIHQFFDDEEKVYKKYGITEDEEFAIALYITQWKRSRNECYKMQLLLESHPQRHLPVVQKQFEKFSNDRITYYEYYFDFVKNVRDHFDKPTFSLRKKYKYGKEFFWSFGWYLDCFLPFYADHIKHNLLDRSPSSDK